MFDREGAARKLMAASTQRKNCQSLGMCLSARCQEHGDIIVKILQIIQSKAKDFPEDYNVKKEK